MPHNMQNMRPPKPPALIETVVASLFVPAPVAVALAVPPAALVVAPAAAELAVGVIVCSCNAFHITPEHDAN